MNKPTLIATVFAFAVLGEGRAQTPAPAAARPEFHLPAGDYSLDEIATHAEAVLRRPIARDRAHMAAATDRRVRLQTDLRLDAAGCEDVLSSLLAARGLALVTDADGRPEVLPLDGQAPQWIRERAEMRTLAELRARPHRAGPVRTVVPFLTGGVLAENLLRPHMVQFGALAPTVECTPQGVTLCGLNDLVLHAVALLAQAEPRLAALAPAPAQPWPRAAGTRMLRLAKGTRATRAFVDEVARELGRNVVWAAADLDRAAPEVRVDADRELDALAYEDAATALLWQAGVQITGLSQHVAPIVATLLAAEAAAAR